MSLDEISRRMKADWNERAREDAKWYVNTYKRGQSDDEFFRQGAAEVDALVRPDLDLMCGDRDPKTLRLLEIGCGIGRMTRHLAAIFGEVVATDVSGEMIAQCRRAHALDNVTWVETSGYDFRAFGDASFDAILSVYVYQHVPSAEVIRANLRDAFRVLRRGGTMHFFTNGVETNGGGDAGSTWEGAAFPEREVRALALALGAQLVSVRGARSQYLSVHWRKPDPGPPGDGGLSIDMASEVTEQERLTRLRACDSASVWMLVTGLSAETDDCARTSCDVDGVRVQPSYVGPVRFWGSVRPDALPTNVTRGARLVEIPVPLSVPAGRRTLVVRASGNRASSEHIIELSLERRRPVVLSVTNDHDGGIDVYRFGGKMKLRVFAMMPEDTPTAGMTILIDRIPIATRAEFLERHGYFMLRGRLPWHVLGRAFRVTVRVGTLVSPVHRVELAGLVEHKRALLRSVRERIRSRLRGRRLDA